MSVAMQQQKISDFSLSLTTGVKMVLVAAKSWFRISCLKK